MLNRIKTVFLCLVTLSLLVTFAACGISKEDVAGVYAGTYTENGSTYSVKITLTERGTYGKTTIKDGEPFSSVAGRYDIKDEEIRLYSSSDKAEYTAYRYDDEQLKQNGNIFKQIEEDDTNNEIVMD